MERREKLNHKGTQRNTKEGRKSSYKLQAARKRLKAGQRKRSIEKIVRVWI